MAEYFPEPCPPYTGPWAFHGSSGVENWSERRTDCPPRSLSVRKQEIGESTFCREETELRNSCLSSGLN
jgi:hypothetical protein